MTKRRSKKQYPATKGATKMTVEPKVPAVPQEQAADTIGNTRRWARMCHGKSVDKAGFPYVHHLDAVARNIYMLAGWDRELIQAGYLHDLIEDTTATSKMLLENGFSQRTVDTVFCVTKYSGEPNYEYISYVIENGRDPMIVKLADLYHNTEEVRLDDKAITQVVRERLEKKYLPAIWRIERALNALGESITPTVTFEQAKAACAPSTVAYAPKWRKGDSPASVVEGDFLKFADDNEDEKYALRVKRRTSDYSKGTHTFTFHDSDSKITLMKGDAFWVKWGGGTFTTATSTSYTPEWIKYMGLPKDWKEGDDLPDPLDIPVYPSYSTAPKNKNKGGTGTVPGNTACSTCHVYNGHTAWCYSKEAKADKEAWDEEWDDVDGKSLMPVVSTSTAVVEVSDPDTGDHLGDLTIDEQGRVIESPETDAVIEKSFDTLIRELDSGVDAD